MVKTILVEDEQIERQAWQMMLENSRLPINILASAEDGEEAYTLISALKPDLVILDINIPELNGFDVLRKAGSQLPFLKSIVITAYDEFKFAQEAVELDVAAFLVKPVREEIFIKTVKETVAEIELERSRFDEYEGLRKQLNSMLPLVELGIVYDLIYGNIAHKQELFERLSVLNINLIPNCVIVFGIENFTVKTKNMNEIRKQIFRKNVYETMLTVIKKQKGSLLVPIGRQFISLIHVPVLNMEKQYNHLLNIVERVSKNVMHSTGAILTAGIGRCYDDPRYLAFSYQEAQYAKRNNVIHNDSAKINHFDDISPISEEHQYSFVSKRELADHVRNGDRARTQYTMSKMLDTIFEKEDITFENIKIKAFEIITIMCQAAAEGGVSQKDLSGISLALLDELEQMTEADELRYWLELEGTKVAEKVKLACETRSSDIVKKAVSYIEQNYNKNITLEEVSRIVHLSPYYFSRIFKKTKGCSFIDFLTLIRIQNAKRLLQNTQLSINYIAKQVGYSDGNYFSQVFKKREGVQPTQYRRYAPEPE